LFVGTLRREGRQKQRRRRPGFAVVFRGGARRVGRVSLNRSEQRLFDYLQTHKDERQFWEGKVRNYVRESADDHLAAGRLDAELWRYYVERSAVAEPFKSAAHHEGLRRTSMRNLAELLVRLWVEPRPKKKPLPGA
jgi:hypothetical protein